MTVQEGGQMSGAAMTRRRFLAAAGMTAAGMVLIPSRQWAAVASSAGRLRSMRHPFYREPIADPPAIPQFAQPPAAPGELGVRIDATAGGALALTMAEAVQDVIGVGLGTPVWGYGLSGGPVACP